MKTNNYLWSMLVTATFVLTGCGSDENGITDPLPQGKTAQLELCLTGSGVNTKATGSALPTQAEENTVKRFTVAIFNSDESVNAIQTVTDNTTSATTINCTPATNCTGIVVANAPTDGYFSGVLNKTDFLKKTITLDDAQTKDCLPMSGDVKDGSGNATFTLSAGSNTGMTAQLSRLVARVSVSSIKMETPAYLTGTYTGSSGTAAYLANAVTPGVDVSTEHKTDYWFYILPNEETTHTALVLEGTFKKNASDAGSTIYYPIIVNKSQTGTTLTGTAGTGTSNIARNTTYAIKATIKNIGTDDPTGEINPTSLELTVNVANWALDITQDVTFE